MTSAGKAHVVHTRRRSNSMGPWFVGHLQAPHMRLTCVDARLRFFGWIKRNGRCGRSPNSRPRFSRRPRAWRRASSFVQKHGYTAAALFELLQSSLVGVEALRFACRGRNRRPPRGPRPNRGRASVMSAQDDLRVFLGGALGIGVLDAQHERAARGASKRPVVNSRAGAADMKLARRAKARNERARQRSNLPYESILPIVS